MKLVDEVKNALKPEIEALEERMKTKVSSDDMNRCINTVLQSQNLVSRDELEAELDKHKQTENQGPPLSPGTQITTYANVVSTEMADRVRREKNIILHGAEEADGNLKKDQQDHDMRMVKDLLTNTLQIQVQDDDVVEVTRFGVKNTKERQYPKPGESKFIPRPLRVILSSTGKRDEVFQNLAKLKGSKYDRLSVRHDLTQLQRKEKDKVLAEAREANEKERSGKYIYRARGHPGKWRVAKIEKATNREEKT